MLFIYLYPGDLYSDLWKSDPDTMIEGFRCLARLSLVVDQ